MNDAAGLCLSYRTTRSPARRHRRSDLHCQLLDIFDLFGRANDAERTQSLSWLFVAATVFGSGVWATHFISALAYEPGFG